MGNLRHNNGLATANTLAALQAGFSWASTTVSGIGERAGNASFAEVAMAARYLCGRTLNLNAAELPALAALVARASGIPVPACAPVVGSRAFAHESGVHVDGTLKSPRAYEPYDPADMDFGVNAGTPVHSRGASLRAAAAAFDLDVTEAEQSHWWRGTHFRLVHRKNRSFCCRLPQQSTGARRMSAAQE